MHFCKLINQHGDHAVGRDMQFVVMYEKTFKKLEIQFLEFVDGRGLSSHGRGDYLKWQSCFGSAWVLEILTTNLH